jgi:hypothetical protein
VFHTCMMLLGIRSREQQKLKGHKRMFLVFFPRVGSGLDMAIGGTEDDV